MTNPSVAFYLKTTSALVAAFAITLSGCSSYNQTNAGSTPTAIQQHQTNLGNVLTDNSGMTLYTFIKDKYKLSNCNNGCAAKWPPLFAQKNSVNSGRFSVITRADNSKQWALDGKPLYKWFKDKKPGDTTGNGVKSVWFVAKP